MGAKKVIPERLVEKNRVLILGAGPIAGEYSKIVSKLGYHPVVIGRGTQSSEKFTHDYQLPALTGGIEAHKDLCRTFSKAIVATSEDTLDTVTAQLIDLGIREIFVEKPGSQDINSLAALVKKSHAAQSKVFVAYNRRYFQSVIELQKRIAADGGLESMFFEFTEWGHVIESIQKNPGVKENWLWHNSSHVIDLAFFIGGHAKEIATFKKGSLDWHPDGSCFVGSGITENNVLFSYHANWEGPGRWGLEFITRKNRYFLRPMEELHCMTKGKVAIEKVQINDELDKTWKPGFYLQTEAFLENRFSELLSLDDQYKKIETYKKILQK